MYLLRTVCCFALPKVCLAAACGTRSSQFIEVRRHRHGPGKRQHTSTERASLGPVCIALVHHSLFRDLGTRAAQKAVFDPAHSSNKPIRQPSPFPSRSSHLGMAVLLFNRVRCRGTTNLSSRFTPGTGLWLERTARCPFEGWPRNALHQKPVATEATATNIVSHG